MMDLDNKANMQRAERSNWYFSAMDTALVTYLDELRTEAVHVRSGTSIHTDAPVDNHGRGAAFSPTDLLATSLAACMITTIGIMAEGKNIPLKGLQARVVKHMAADPRRVARVEVHLELIGEGLGDRERAMIEHTARTCPVAVSLHPDLIQEMVFRYV
jgi:putative redox protein